MNCERPDLGATSALFMTYRASLISARALLIGAVPPKSKFSGMLGDPNICTISRKPLFDFGLLFHRRGGPTVRKRIGLKAGVLHQIQTMRIRFPEKEGCGPGNTRAVMQLTHY